MIFAGSIVRKSIAYDNRARIERGNWVSGLQSYRGASVNSRTRSKLPAEHGGQQKILRLSGAGLL